MTLRIDLLPRLDAGDRTTWHGEQNVRSLTDLGRRQAAAFVATPADFDATPVGPQGLAPELGQHTEEVLEEVGYDWDEIIPLKEKRAIP